jgi:hypothetical protein
MYIKMAVAVPFSRGGANLAAIFDIYSFPTDFYSSTVLTAQLMIPNIPDFPIRACDFVGPVPTALSVD